MRIITIFSNDQRIESVVKLDETAIKSSKMKAILNVLLQKTINKTTLRLHLCTMVTQTTTGDSNQDGSTSKDKEDNVSIRRPRKKRKMYDT